MKRKKKVEAALPTVVLTAASLMTIMTYLVKYIQEYGGNVDQCLNLLAQPGGDPTLRVVAKLIADLSIAKVKKAKIAAKRIVSPYLAGSYDVIVDLSQNLEQMIAAGRYDDTNSDINIKNFSLNKSGKRRVRKHKVRVELFYFNQNFKKDEKIINGEKIIAKLKEVNSWLARQGVKYRYRFARIEELLALGATQPELQQRFLIAALGSIWHDDDGRRSFAYLGGYNAECYLHLGSLGCALGDCWLFAVVREPACR
ncbi:MAG: hypothetical protein WCT16_02700 [Candidatus Buchananbacteria bacterium]